MFIRNRLTQHVSGIIMPIVRKTDCIKPRVLLASTFPLCCRLTPNAILYSLSPDDGNNVARNMLS